MNAARARVIQNTIEHVPKRWVWNWTTKRHCSQESQRLAPTMWHIKSTCTERLWSWHTPMKCFRHTHAFDKRCRQTCLQTISTVNEHTTVNNAHLRVQPRIRQVFVPFQNIFAGRDVHLHAENRMPLHVQHKNYGTQPHKESQHEPPGTLPPLSLKQVMLKYGKIALVMHSTVYIATLTCVYVGLQYGAPDTVAAVVSCHCTPVLWSINVLYSNLTPVIVGMLLRCLCLWCGRQLPYTMFSIRGHPVNSCLAALCRSFPLGAPSCMY